jgi:hypothetical protein
MALRKVYRVAELHHVAKKVGPVTEALQNPRHLLPAGFLTPLVIDYGHVASSIGVFNQLNFGLFVIHGAGLAISGIYHDNDFRNMDFSVEKTRLG